MTFIELDQVVDGAGDTWKHEETNYMLNASMCWFSIHEWKNQDNNTESLIICRDDSEDPEQDHTHLLLYHHRQSWTTEDHLAFGSLEHCVCLLYTSPSPRD